MTLPPGQRRIEGFPRFGTHFDRPAPAVPANAVIEISGIVRQPFSVRIAELKVLPRRELTSDFHCVAGWSATGLHWEGVAFDEFYRRILEPAVRPDATATHVVFGGLDGFESVAELTDVLAPNVLIAQNLDGHPLDSDHGAPARLVSPDQYGYINVKHLCTIEILAGAPTRELGAATPFAQRRLRGPFVMRHSRARVWEEERHPYIPARWLRPLYRLTIRRGINAAARPKDDRGPADGH